MMEDKEWYSSHGEPMTMLEFLEIEVGERGNYTPDEVDEWWEKYDIGLFCPVIWVTNIETRNAIKMDVRHIITESDDGKGGYLGVL